MFGKNEIVGKKFFNKKSKLFKEPSLLVTSMFMTIQGEGPYAGKPAFFIRLAKCNLDCHFCFVGTTIITYGREQRRRITRVKVGDWVLSWDEKKAVYRHEKVLEINKSYVNTLARVKFEKVSGPTFVTPDHLYLVGKRWVQAKDLKRGNKVRQAPKEADLVGTQTPKEDIYLTVENVYVFNREDKQAWANLGGGGGVPIPVYNLKIANTGTYAANNAVVHNCDTFFDKGTWMSFSAINKAIDKTLANCFPSLPDYAKRRDMVLVVTGGEPTLQDNLTSFLEDVGGSFRETQVESNGTVKQELPWSTTYVVSPKCSTKTGKYLKISKANLARADCLKFVMEDAPSPYNEIPDWAHEWAKDTGKPIYISPMNVYNEIPHSYKIDAALSSDSTVLQRAEKEEVVSFWEDGLLDREANQRNHEYAAKYCLQHGFTLNLQLHLYASLA